MALNIYRLFTVTLCFLGLLGSSRSQVSLPDTRQGKIVGSFIDTFNSGDDEKMRQFFLDNVSQEGLQERPAEARVERMKVFRHDTKSLTLVKLIDVSQQSISLLAKSGNGDTLSLVFDLDKNQKFDRLRIEMGGRPKSTSGPPLTRKELIASVEQYLAKRVRDNLFSGAVLVARGNSILLKKAYGEADKRFHIPNRTDTKFNIGSMNKFFTRLAVAQLVEQGKISLDKPINTYIPDYPNRAVAENVTVHQLLDMSSGMGDFFGEKFEKTPKDNIRTLTDYLKFFVDDSLLFEPGTQHRYSNAGFIILGLIIEKVSGKDYYSYVDEHIFHPADMMNTGWYETNGVTPNLATGYLHPEGDEHSWISNIHMLPERGSSAGGGYTTLDDMLTFIHKLLDGKFLSPRYTAWMLTDILPDSNPPLPLREGGIGIAGGTPGVNAAVEFDARSGNIVIVFSNYSPPSAEEPGQEISGWLSRMK